MARARSPVSGTVPSRAGFKDWTQAVCRQGTASVSLEQSSSRDFDSETSSPDLGAGRPWKSLAP
jgi:hypothetical protein